VVPGFFFFNLCSPVLGAIGFSSFSIHFLWFRYYKVSGGKKKKDDHNDKKSSSLECFMSSAFQKE
jgi:hypothetical protein